MTHLTRRNTLALGSAWLAGCALPGIRPSGAADARPDQSATARSAASPGANPAPSAAADLAAIDAGPVLQPPTALLLQDVPAVHQGLVDAVAPYGDFAGHTLADWHPSQRELLLLHRPEGGNTQQLYRLAQPGATPQRLTDGPEPVSMARWLPSGDGQVLLARASGGNEAYQLYRLQPDTRAQTLLTAPDQRHAFAAWLPRSGDALVFSVPLDRTAATGSRSVINTTLTRLNPLQPERSQPLAQLPGVGWFMAAVSPDEGQVVLMRHVSATASELWRLNLGPGPADPSSPAAPAAPVAPPTPNLAQLLPRPGAPTAVFRPLDFSPDGQHLWLLSDQAGEFVELMRLHLPTTQLQRLPAPPPWDVEDAQPSADGRIVAARLNVDGRDELRLFDATTLKPLPLPASLPPGSVASLQCHNQRPELAMAIVDAQSPSRVWTLQLDTGQVQPWTTPRLHPALRLGELTQQQTVRWRSFDGRPISGWINRPPARFKGRRPVLVSIHGGPEGQAKAGFGGRSNYLLQALGIAQLQPNVRGSSGYGKTFLDLDNGRLREDAVKDIGALFDWIATQPDLDPQRVVVIGGSYGGYMSLAVAATYPQRIAGAIDVVGISHFVTFLQTTESYRRDLRRVEYGDERDPAMREFLHRISPLTNAHRITKPLFVAQGRNDPRVPYTEAEQIVAKVRANGTPVWYLRAENEGHGFARKENADYQFYAMVLFLRGVMGLGV